MSGAISTAAPSATRMTPQQNLQQRQLLLQSNQPQRTNLGTYSVALGNTLRLNPNNTGITTGIELEFMVTLTNTATTTATLTPGPRSPYSLVTNINYKDYNQINRVNCTGQQLFQLLTERAATVFDHGKGGYYGRDNSAASPIGPGTTYAETWGDYSVPTTITGSGSATLAFTIYVPLAYQEANDLRGAIFSQTSIGNMLLSVQLATNLWASSGGTNGGGVYTGSQPGTVNASAVTINAWQRWLSPQPIGGMYPNPSLDLMTVYEINGGIIDQTNLVSGQDKYINYPTVRSVLASYIDYANPEGTYNGGSDVNYLKLLVNSNNVMQWWGPHGMNMDTKSKYGSSQMNGQYILRSRKVPIQTALEGNVQIVFNASSVQSNAFLWEMFESFYPLGAVMPGVASP